MHALMSILCVQVLDAMVGEMMPYVDAELMNHSERNDLAQRVSQQLRQDVPDLQEQAVLFRLFRSATSWQDDVSSPTPSTSPHRVRHALPKAMLDAVRCGGGSGSGRSGEESSSFAKGCSRLSNFMVDVPLVQTVLDTASAMMGNAEYFTALADASPLAWQIQVFESVLRCMAERGHPIVDLNAVAFSSSSQGATGGQTEQLNCERMRFKEEVDIFAKTSIPLLISDGKPGKFTSRSFDDASLAMRQMTNGLLTPEFFARHPLLVCAGGSVCKACVPSLSTRNLFTEQGSDIDLFVVGARDHGEASAAVRAALEDLLERIRHTYNTEVTEALVSVTRNSVNVSILDPTDNPILHLEVQFVMRLFR